MGFLLDFLFRIHAEVPRCGFIKQFPLGISFVIPAGGSFKSFHWGFIEGFPLGIPSEALDVDSSNNSCWGII